MAHPAGRIVVGVDGSPESLEAIRWAARQAELSGCQLEAISAWKFPASSGFEFGGEADNDWAGNARTVLDAALLQALGKDSEATALVERGHPAQVLVAAAVGAEMLVVGSRGHGGLVGMLLGSVSEYVTAHATCPVVVIHGDSTESSRPDA